MKLYDFELSGNCHKVRMMLSLLDLEYEKVSVDLRKKEQMRPEFAALNPLRKVPVLVDGDVVVRDSAAILVYLARRYGRDEWFPDDPTGMAEVQQWLSFSVHEVFNGLAMARAIVIFKRDFDPKLAHALSAFALEQLEFRLRNNEWLALDRFTLADLVCYPYTGLIHEANLTLDDYPTTRAWCMRMEAMPGYVAMPGLPYPHKDL
jgi:glutathione S-transferase